MGIESKDRWVASRWSKIGKKLAYNGYYKEEETAARASDTLARKLMVNGEQKHKLNFPEDNTEVYPEINQKFKYIGVNYSERNSGWDACRWSKIDKKPVYNGHYKDEET